MACDPFILFRLQRAEHECLDLFGGKGAFVQHTVE